MRVLHINSYYKAGKFYKNLYDQQKQQNLKIDVFVPYMIGEKIEDFEYGGYTKIKPIHNKTDRLFFNIKHNKIYKAVKEEYKLEKYSILHAHSLFSNGIIALKIYKEFGIPYVVAVRNTDVNIFFKKMYHLRKIGIEILENASKIVFLSTSYKNNVINNFIPKEKVDNILRKTVIIPNGIDEFWFQNKVKGKELRSNKEIKIVQVGDINKNKNIITTSLAVKILRSEGLDVNLYAIGSIKNKKIFNNLNKQKYFHYLGYKDKKELLSTYHKMDIFVMPSLNETFGLVYGEAMTQGLPIIYSRDQGFDNQFNDGEVGYSVDSLNEKEIAQKIILIINNYSTLSNKAINKSNNFEWKKISEKYMKLYNEIIKY